VTSTTTFLHHWFSSCLVFRSVWCFVLGGGGGAVVFYSSLCTSRIGSHCFFAFHDFVVIYLQICGGFFSLFFLVGGFLSFADRSVCCIWNIDGTIAPRIVTLDTGSWCFGLGFWRWVLLRFGCEIFFLHDCVAETLICRKRRYSTKRVSAGRIASDSEEFANQVLGFWIVLWMALVREN